MIRVPLRKTRADEGWRVGQEAPESDLIVSSQHRSLVEYRQLAWLFVNETLVAIKGVHDLARPPMYEWETPHNVVPVHLPAPRDYARIQVFDENASVGLYSVERRGSGQKSYRHETLWSLAQQTRYTAWPFTPRLL